MVDHGTFALSERSLSVLSVYTELFGADGVCRVLGMCVFGPTTTPSGRQGMW